MEDRLAAGALEREPSPEDFDRIEGEFRIEAALNVAGLAEACCSPENKK